MSPTDVAAAVSIEDPMMLVVLLVVVVVPLLLLVVLLVFSKPNDDNGGIVVLPAPKPKRLGNPTTVIIGLFVHYYWQ